MFLIFCQALFVLFFAGVRFFIFLVSRPVISPSFGDPSIASRLLFFHISISPYNYIIAHENFHAHESVFILFWEFWYKMRFSAFFLLTLRGYLWYNFRALVLEFGYPPQVLQRHPICRSSTLLGTCERVPVPCNRLKNFHKYPLCTNRAVAMSAAVGHDAPKYPQIKKVPFRVLGYALVK